MPTKVAVVLPASTLPCEIVLVTPVDNVIEPEKIPTLFSDSDPPVTVAENPSLSTKLPLVIVPLELIATVPLVQPGSFEDGKSKKVKKYHVPARSELLKAARPVVGMARETKKIAMSNPSKV